MSLMGCLTDADEYPHLSSRHPDWRESYYFNFVDIDNGISGFTTIGLLPNLGKREFVFVLFHADRREVYFVEPEGSVTNDSLKSLSDGRLEYALVSPLKEWIIRFAGEKLTADIRWKARFPVCDFGGGSETSWSGHFEQSGHVDGTVSLPGGPDIVLKGLGQRDKSWGPRDWHIDSWYALHAQFNSYSIALRRDVVKNAATASGAISTSDGHVAISKVDLETKFANGTDRMPIAATTCIHGVDGTRYTLHSSLISPVSFLRFSRGFPGGTTELFEEMTLHECEESGERATGLTEWLFTHHKTSAI
jgi:hypothetical protein